MQNYTHEYIIGIRFKALSDKFRRFLLGLIYTEGPLYQADILKQVEIRSNKLAYHLGKLYDAGLIEREYEKQGPHFSKYKIKEEGKKFLEAIGASDKLDGMKIDFSSFSSSGLNNRVNNNKLWLDSLIKHAIANKRIIEFDYDGNHRIAEPHIYGTLDRKYELLAYQIGGGSSSDKIPNWRRVKLNKVSNTIVTERTFPCKRRFPSGRQSSFDRRIAIVA